jgi:hypothetical protein
MSVLYSFLEEKLNVPDKCNAYDFTVLFDEFINNIGQNVGSKKCFVKSSEYIVKLNEDTRGFIFADNRGRNWKESSIFIEKNGIDLGNKTEVKRKNLISIGHLSNLLLMIPANDFENIFQENIF